MASNKNRLNKHLKKREIKDKTEALQSEIIQLQTLTGGALETYYMNIKQLDEDALTMFWKPKQAANNALDGHEMVQSAIDGYKDVLAELTKGYNAVQAANDTFKDSDWLELQNKLNQIVAGISTTARFTEFNGIYLINGEYASSTKSESATFLVGVKPTDTVKFSPRNMNPGVLGDAELEISILADDGETYVERAFLDHFHKGGHGGVKVSIASTDSAQAALVCISKAMNYVKETLTDADLIQEDLVRIQGFMNAKAQKGLNVLINFKNDRALELASELEDLEGQLDLLNTMGD